MPETVIAFTNGEADIDFFQDFFISVVAIKKVYNPYASFDKDIYQTIFICKKPKQDFAGLSEAFKKRIFEYSCINPNILLFTTKFPTPYLKWVSTYKIGRLHFPNPVVL